MGMTATYMGYQYKEGEYEGHPYTNTYIHLVKPFRLDEKNFVGDKCVVEKVKADLRKKLQEFAPGQLVEIGYDSGPGGNAVLSYIEAAK